MFVHSHVQALWDGWFARAALHDVAQTATDQDKIETLQRIVTEYRSQTRDVLRHRGDLRTHIIAAIDRHLGDGIPGTKEAADAILSLVSPSHRGSPS